MDFNIRDAVGALYRVDPDLGVHRMDVGITLSNGIAWSPDDRTMYYCDSRPGRIYAYDYDLATGTIGNRRLFVDFKGRKGRPDGCTVDAEGGLWVAEISASQVVRFDPSGKEEFALRLPVSRPTSVMFGGSDLRTLFITSMKHGLSAEELAREPQAAASSPPMSAWRDCPNRGSRVDPGRRRPE
jgi:L-arabinonolactonase